MSQKPSQSADDKSELLAIVLDALEDIVRRDLAGLKVTRTLLLPGSKLKRNTLLQLDLTHALTGIAKARAELARYPQGARLALTVMDVQLNRLRVDAEYGRQHYQGARKGSTVADERKRRR